MNTKRVWILDEGSQGHLVQSRGLLRELAKVVPLDISEVRVQPALSFKQGRSLAKRLLRFHPREWLFRSLYPALKLPDTRPDLIVSSGPHSLTELEYLARLHGCPSVFVQGTLHVPEGAVTVIMRPFEGRHRDDFIFVPLLFTEITPEVVDAARKQFLSENPILPNGPVHTLFIGNSSAKIRFTDDDWDAVIRFVNESWSSDGCQWLITTSYRTDRELEDRFRRGIEPDAILDAVWYSQAPRKVTKPFLGLADRVFVTMDSLTMLTEAIASGRPTCALCPSGYSGELTNTHLNYVAGLIENGYISPIQLGREIVTSAMPSVTPSIDYSVSIHQLLGRLEWTP